MSRYVHMSIAALALSACATHPTISPVPLKRGETFMAYTLSSENVMPLVVYRRGLSDAWDLGLRVGLPVVGSGVDISRLLSTSDRRSDVMNLSYGFNPNHNIDITYYRVSHRTRTRKKDSVRRLRYFGLRGMFILNGIGGRSSTRFGVLVGGGRRVRAADEASLPRFHRFQWELGYFHDFNSMPLRAVIDPKPFDKGHELWQDRYADSPHSTRAGFPTEHARITGFSLRVSFPLRVAPKGAVDEDGGS
ncbi:MAG: hypothetical protein IH971_06390 [Candidatus Marinimicrobia bacterium]|nr:hypothetical protein [Candidatus Neomarinimicrobiota bacterium]